MFLLQLRKPHIFRACVCLLFALLCVTLLFHGSLSTVSFVFFLLLYIWFALYDFLLHTELIHHNERKRRKMKIPLVAHKFMVLLHFFCIHAPSWLFDLLSAAIVIALKYSVRFQITFYFHQFFPIFRWWIRSILTYFRWNSIYIQPFVYRMEIYPKISVFIFFLCAFWYIFLFTVK